MRLKRVLFMIVLFILGIGITKAASITLKSNASTVIKGNTFKVTASVSGGAGWEYCLNYDTSLLTLTSPANPCVLGGTLAGNKSVTFTFKTKAKGTASISLKNVSVLDDNANELSVSKNSISVKIKTQEEIEASYSTNADLKSLGVEGYTISPTFNKEVLKYELEVENNVEKVKVVGEKDDSSASVRGLGEVSLTEGTNSFDIVVTAEKGNKKTYVIIITRKELNPINVTIDGKKYSVVRKVDGLEVPIYYTSSSVKIDDEDVPAFVSEVTGYTLVALKNEEGKIGFYIYDGKYRKYIQIGTEGVCFVPEEPSSIVPGFPLTKKVSIGDAEIEAYYSKETDDTLLIYGMNVATGKKNWYRYDEEEKTFQRYNDGYLSKLQKDNNDYFRLIILFASGLVLTILIIAMLTITNKKLKNKNNKMYTILENLKKENETKKNEVEKSKKTTNKKKANK